MKRLAVSIGSRTNEMAEVNAPFRLWQPQVKVTVHQVFQYAARLDWVRAAQASNGFLRQIPRALPSRGNLWTQPNRRLVA